MGQSSFVPSVSAALAAPLRRTDSSLPHGAAGSGARAGCVLVLVLAGWVRRGLSSCECERGAVDVHVNVHGGGFTGQTGAIILGLARALRGYDSTLEPILRDNNFLTRDPRKVERKKYGQRGARRRFQFSKR